MSKVSDNVNNAVAKIHDEAKIGPKNDNIGQGVTNQVANAVLAELEQFATTMADAATTVDALVVVANEGNIEEVKTLAAALKTGLSTVLDGLSAE